MTVTHSSRTRAQAVDDATIPVLQASRFANRCRRAELSLPKRENIRREGGGIKNYKKGPALGGDKKGIKGRGASAVAKEAEGWFFCTSWYETRLRGEQKKRSSTTMHQRRMIIERGTTAFTLTSIIVSATARLFCLLFAHLCSRFNVISHSTVRLRDFIVKLDRGEWIFL